MFKGRFGMKSSELLVLLQQFPEEAFGVCWDTSHGELSSPNQAEEMALVKSRIVATHISDNLGQADDHLYPYRGQVDWAAVVGVLREQPWVLNFEVPGEMSRCPLELRGALVEYGFAVGKHLLNL